ncbi:MAG: tRNA (N(6)-L-threonylcarbamoyladenosine(37)-C(2))-methylthiotransferase MtaB [Prevotellaceae bacterium]|jgi:threonylcarbamoyladenosine tRNA methylthiotransferase MtaB|nr:tRNA (N(6)-L-threonylcarbamoyladenosine(37)-C(2))-methylthiotransferase MtaB [Prevotellaceae bacterium]
MVNSLHKSRTFCVVNLGCKLNFAEASTLARQLGGMGFVQAGEGEAADVYVVHTCAVTAQAEKKCRQAIRKLAGQGGNAAICVTGCYALLKGDELRQMPGVTLVADKREAVQKIGEYFARSGYACCPPPTSTATDDDDDADFFTAYSSGDRTRSFLKVQDGCDYRCSYCTVPLARGASRSAAIEKVAEQARKIAEQGVNEVVLTGVNIGDFGKSTGENFLQLAQRLEAVEGISRYRISSIEPNLLTAALVDFVAGSSKFLPHFHIPLQAGSNRVLGLMRRRYTRELFAEKLRYIRAKMPLAFIGVDVIAGFPTETEEEFESACSFLEELQPSYLHIFPYSKRPNTPAAAMPQTPDAQISSRAKRLGALCAALQADFYRQNVGKTGSVLFESACRNGRMFGFSENYVKVALPYSADLANKIVPVRMTGVGEDGNMRCEVVK